MKIAVVGLGGVGGFVAANLTKTSHEVVGFARGEHLRAIQKNGLSIVEDTQTWNVKLDARESQEAEGIFDIVLFCVKSYDLISSYEAIKAHLDTHSVLVCFSNGVSHGDVLRDISKSKVLDGCLYILAHQESPGVIRKKGKVFAAVFGGLEKEAKELKSVFDEAELRAKIPEDIQTDIWKKYIFISAFATLTSYYDKSIGYVCAHYLVQAEETLKEIAMLAYAKGVDIFDEVEKSLTIAKSLPYDASTSMHLDFTNKKRDELEILSGFIVKEAKKLHVEVPRMQQMYEELLTKHNF